MSLLIRNCLSTSNANIFVQNCCSSFGCEIFNTDKAEATITSFLLEFGGVSWIVNNIQIDNNPVSLPFTIPSLTSVILSFDVCADSGSQDVLNLRLQDLNGNQYTYAFPCDAIGFQQTTNMPAVVDFGNVPINTSAIQNLSFNNVIAGCNNWYFADCFLPYSMVPSINVCNANGTQNIPITFAPTGIGLLQQYIVVNFNECASIPVLLTGYGVESPSGGGGGNPVSGPPKKIVDCPTDCKLFNPQPGFSQNTKNAINQISRITAPKGGAGRGTNFRKK